MSEGFRRWWPALPAALILYLAGQSFLEKYPRPPKRNADRSPGATVPDSLSAFIRRAGEMAAAGETPAAPDPKAGSENPFRPIQSHRPEAKGQAVRMEPPPRNFLLKGTVGNNVATIANNAGIKQIVKVGDRIDSAEVVSIETDKVVLKDRGGRFDLLFRK